MMIRDGTVLEDIPWAKMVLILKGKGGYRGKVLVKVM